MRTSKYYEQHIMRIIFSGKQKLQPLIGWAIFWKGRKNKRLIQ